ncbi:MAG: type II toxin-antitoxin system VapC family toxin [Candidatus Daviesbacteria bacterium]|nr:type II toxin-antitoxin system VapC family toxin [Candidatus Daviesbacteria bacterium]
MKLIVDTSILIDHLRGGNAWKKIAGEIDDDTQLFVPTIVLFELFSGTSTKDPVNVRQIYKLLSNFQRLDLSEAVARQAGELYRDTKKTLQVPDYIIAASALQMNATVVTLNKKHFAQITHLSLYPLP